MSQASGHSCPACGTPVPAGQRFCTNCGTDLSVTGPASQYGGSSPQQSPFGQPQQQVPPYSQTPGAFGQQPPQPYQQAPRSNPVAEALGALGLLFFLRRYQPGYRPHRQRSSGCGCLLMLIILLLVVGVPAYVYYRAHPNVINQIKSQFQSSGNSVNNRSLPTNHPTITTVNINQSVTYSGVNITIESVQQATIFTDDTSVPSDTNGIIRIKIKETNNSGQNGGYFYSNIAHLILPDKSSVAPLNELKGGAPDTGTVRENWLDFAAPTSDKINQMTLVLGSSQDAQISVPLTGKANLSTFQDKKVNLNTALNYQGLNYMLQSATETLSIPGKQATSGMRYVILSFKVDNPSSRNAIIGSTQDYMRLKAGEATTAPANTTLPFGLNANTSGATGTVAFLMPENNTSYTLIFLAAQGYSNLQVTTDFKIQ